MSNNDKLTRVFLDLILGPYLKGFDLKWDEVRKMVVGTNSKGTVIGINDNDEAIVLKE